MDAGILVGSTGGHGRCAEFQFQRGSNAIHWPPGPGNGSTRSARAFGYWAALAYALAELGKRDEAAAAAQEALREASTEQDRQHARQLAHIATTDLKTQMIHDSEGRTRMTTARVELGTTDWNPFVEPSDRMRRSSGQLSEVLCDADKLTGFRVLTTSGPITLDVPDPHHVLIENGPDEYVCGEAQGKAVQVDYAITESGDGSKTSCVA